MYVSKESHYRQRRIVSKLSEHGAEKHESADETGVHAHGGKGSTGARGARCTATAVSY